VDQAAKKRALRLIPYGVFAAGTGVGSSVDAWTVSWLTQTSFDPPLVALAVRVDSTAYSLLRQSGRYSITVLSADQRDVGDRLSRHFESTAEKLGGVSYRLSAGGCPVIEGGLAWWECQVVQVIERGDHHLFIGEVVDAGFEREGSSLTLAASGQDYCG
jgi:flavin reductase (DIM6/NTAB) family NADH-FMN oxidoreductase RutF